MPDRSRTDGSGLLDQLPTDRLVQQGQQLLGLLAEQAIEKAVGSVEGLAERLLDYAHHGGPGLIPAIMGGSELTEPKPPLSATVKTHVTGISESVKQALSGAAGHRRSGQVIRTTNIAEQIDVGVPVRLAYDKWTQFQDFSQFMKTVSAVEKTSDENSSWKVQILWSSRDWDAAIIEQIPDERIVWRSAGTRGHVDGVVSFHAMAPSMTRILLALVYYPKGLLERTGNFWGVQARRVRWEIKQFKYHVMTHVALDPDSAQGWRGEIRDGTVVRTHEEAIAPAAQEPGENPERAAVPDPPTGDDAAEEDDYEDEPAEHDDYDDDEYDDADEPYDDTTDEEHDDEPERAYAPAERR
jgi:uncharacterized membrane protein